MIPSERELSEESGINRLTVRQAINELVQEDFCIAKEALAHLSQNRRSNSRLPD